jgi:23S rRNA (uridine2552-2'-O)-methyltransferase
VSVVLESCAGKTSAGFSVQAWSGKDTGFAALRKVRRAKIERGAQDARGNDIRSRNPQRFYAIVNESAISKSRRMARYEPHDKFYRKARQHGWPSRAAFKIEELVARFKLARAGDRVADLGCAPGGWLAVLSRVVGRNGRVAGVDLTACRSDAPNVTTIMGDINDPVVRAAAAATLGGEAGLVTSDLAPKLTGIRERDQAASMALVETAIAFSRAILKPGGAMVAKCFMGADFGEVRALFAPDFDKVEAVRVRASRPGSSELYIVARAFDPSRRKA